MSFAVISLARIHIFYSLMRPKISRHPVVFEWSYDFWISTKNRIALSFTRFEKSSLTLRKESSAFLARTLSCMSAFNGDPHRRKTARKNQVRIQNPQTTVNHFNITQVRTRTSQAFTYSRNDLPAMKEHILSWQDTFGEGGGLPGGVSSL